MSQRSAKSIRRPTVARTAPAPVVHAMLAPWRRRLWSSCRPIAADDTAGRYLAARGCALPPPDSDLKWHPALKHPGGHVGPALVGLVTAIVNVGRWLNLHRTWIASDGSGRKAFDYLPKDDERPKARLVLKDHTTIGGCIRLWADCDVDTHLTVGEGIETCLAAARTRWPAWSCLNASNLKALPLLVGIESLTIVRDHDPAGIAATREAGLAGIPLAARCASSIRQSREPIGPTWPRRCAHERRPRRRCRFRGLRAGDRASNASSATERRQRRGHRRIRAPDFNI